MKMPYKYKKKKKSNKILNSRLFWKSPIIKYDSANILNIAMLILIYILGKKYFLLYYY